MMCRNTVAHYEIPYFPDLSLPEYTNLLGDQALAVAASRLANWLRLTAASGKYFHFVLRYRYTPTPATGLRHHRLRLQVLLGQPAGTDALGSDETPGSPSVMGNAIGASLGERLVTRIIHLEPVAATDTELEREQSRRLYVLARKPILVKDGANILYRPSPWRRSSQSREALEPFLDEAFDSLETAAFIDIHLQKADVRLVRDALIAASADLNPKGGAFAYYLELYRDAYMQLLDEILTGPVCEMLVVAGGADERASELLRTFALESTGGIEFDVLEVKTDAHREGIGRMLRGGPFYQPFAEAEGWYSEELRQHCNIGAAEGRSLVQRERLCALSYLQVLAGAGLVEDLLTLPVPRRGRLRTFPIETEYRASRRQETEAAAGPEIVFGEELDRSFAVQMAAASLSKHAFIAGVTGSGKTTSVFNILEQLGRNGIPFLVFEPAKSEYRSLARLPVFRSGNLKVYTPGKEHISPLRVNPFEFGTGTLLGEHVANLVSAICGSLPLFEPLPSILEEAVWTLYERYGWVEDDDGGCGNRFPRLGELLPTAESVLDSLNYATEVNSNFRAAFRSRFVRLSRGSVGRFFDAVTTEPAAAELFAHSTVLELGALSQDEVNLATMFLLVAIREYLKGHREQRELKLVLVLEEAHNLVPAWEGGVGNEQGRDARSEASRFITAMLAEMRALGLGILVVDQTPSAVSPHVIRSTNLKLCHRTVAREDRETLASAMLMDSHQEEMLGRLQIGQAFFYAEHYHRPVRLLSQKASAERLDADDDVRFSVAERPFLGWLDQQPWYQTAYRLRVEALSARLGQCVSDGERWLSTVRRGQSALREQNLAASETALELRKAVETSIMEVVASVQRSQSDVEVLQRIGRRMHSQGASSPWPESIYGRALAEAVRRLRRLAAVAHQLNKEHERLIAVWPETGVQYENNE